MQLKTRQPRTKITSNQLIKAVQTHFDLLGLDRPPHDDAETNYYRLYKQSPKTFYKLLVTAGLRAPKKNYKAKYATKAEKILKQSQAATSHDERRRLLSMLPAEQYPRVPAEDQKVWLERHFNCCTPKSLDIYCYYWLELPKEDTNILLDPTLQFKANYKKANYAKAAKVAKELAQIKSQQAQQKAVKTQPTSEPELGGLYDP